MKQQGFENRFSSEWDAFEHWLERRGRREGPDAAGLPDSEMPRRYRRICQQLALARDRRYGAALVWVLAANPARFFYETLGGRRVAEQQERLWGTQLPEYAYHWPDLSAALAAGFRVKRPQP